MKHRRRFTDRGKPSFTQVWVTLWILALITSILMWNYAEAQSYGRETYYAPYTGWHSDLLREQRRQTELMEEAEERLRWDRSRQTYEDQRDRMKRYHEGLRQSWQ